MNEGGHEPDVEQQVELVLFKGHREDQAQFHNKHDREESV